ncbi:MAG: phage tail tape measure protein [Ruminococcus sp.]|nr:phage tail tape measure protein [Ruminococcus sp.]
MASSKIKGINIKIGADTTGLDSALKNIEKSGKNTTSELNEIRRAINQNKDSVILWQQKQEVLTKAIENSKEKTNLLLQAQKGIEQSFRDGDIDRQAYDKFKEKLQKATDKLNDLKSQQSDFEQKFQSGEIDKDAYDKFINKVQRAEREVQALENSQRSMEENVRLKTVSEEQYRAFQREIEATCTETSRLEGQLEQANQRVEELGDGLEHSGQQAENSANGGYTVLGNVFANVITKGIEIAGTALKNFTQDIIATGTEYESAISNVVAISGAMAEEVELLQAKAEEMGATTKFTAAESAEAMSYMAMAGWKVNDMVSGLEGIMDLSAASGESLASVSDIVTDALTALGYQASDSAHFADVLAAASSNANTNVAMMGESFKYVAPVAGSMGTSVEDLAIALGLMANSGIKASQAGNSLKNALVNLVKPTEAQISAMASLGLAYTETKQVFDDDAIAKAQEKVTKKTRAYEEAIAKHNSVVAKYDENSVQFLTSTNKLENALDDLNKAQDELTKAQQGTTKQVLTGADAFTDEYGNMKSLREIMDALRDSLGKIDVALVDSTGNAREYEDIISELSQTTEGLVQSEQLQNAGILFGKQNLSGMLAIINATDEDYKKLIEAVDNADGTAKNMASTMLDNLQGDRTLLESAFDGMKIAISKELNPALRDLTQYTTAQMPKIQKAIEPIADFVKNVIKSAPKLVDGLQKISPILAGIGHALLNITALSLMPKITTFCTTTIPTVILPAIKGLFATISAHPIVAVIVAVEALTASFIAYKNSQLDVKSEGELLIEQQNAEIEALYDKRRAIEDLNNAFYENVDGIQNQTDRTKDLWSELDKLADQYGNVQQKDKARAEYILNELNDALGTEYTMTGNQIEGYKNLSAEIDNVIAKKQAEMMLDSYLANSTEMTKQRIEARSNYEKYNDEYQEKKKALDNAIKQYEEITGTSWKTNTREVDKDTAYRIIEDEAAAFLGKNSQEYSDYVNAAKTLWNAQNEENQVLSLRNEAEKAYQATSEYFDNLEQLQEAYSLGQYDRMAEIIYAEKDLTSTTLDESATDAEQRLQAYSDSCLKTLSDFQLAVRDMKQKSVDELENQLNDTMQKGIITEKTPKEIWANFSESFEKFQNAGLDISPLLSWTADSEVTPADIFGNEWKEVFKKQYENGGDMETLLKWAKNSGYTKGISLIFGSEDNFTDYLKEQFKTGQDIEYLLEWGAESGLATSEEFVDIYKKTVQKNLDKGFNVGGLLEWGNKAGIDLGDVFGGKFGANWQMLVDTLDADITEFIKWGEKSGLKVSDIFSDEYIENFQSYLNSVDSNLDMDAFVMWANSKGLLMGDIFGENFIERVNEYLDSANNSINEVSDSINNKIYGPFNEKDTLAKRTKLIGPVPFMADGGFLSRGQAVVAEAGPELLEIVNGGVRVTPLTQNSRNTPVSSGGGQKVFYSNYTINATISGGYDVSRLAEDLETERRRIEMGLGKI